MRVATLVPFSGAEAMRVATLVRCHFWLLLPDLLLSCVCMCHGLTAMPHEIETTISHEEHLPPTTTHHYMFLNRYYACELPPLSLFERDL